MASWHRWQGGGKLPTLNFSLLENFISVRKFYYKGIGKKGFSLKFRKPSWTEQSKSVSECILKCNFFMQMYCMSKFRVIFPHMQNENSQQRSSVLFHTNFAVENLRLSVRKLQLNARTPTFLILDAAAG